MLPTNTMVYDTNAVLPAAESANAVRERCHCCRVGGPVGGVVVDDDVIAAYSPEASPLLPSGVMDPTAAATRKTLDSNGDGNGNGNGDGGNGGDGGDNGDGNGDGGGGVRRMRWRRPPTPPG